VMDVSVASSTRPSYDALAPVYDGLTAHHDYEGWLAQLLGLAGRHGLSGSRALDVACGTGKSFMPLVRRGWDVTACDLSAAMVARARRRARGHRVRLSVADMRSLPLLCERADLVTCLDDGVNYLHDAAELRAGLAGMAANLRPGGLLVFDVNTLATYRSVFCEGISWRNGSRVYAAAGEPRSVEPGALYATTLRAWRDGRLLAESRQVQRHHGAAELERALADAGLELLGLYGSAADGSHELPPDEQRHVKFVAVAQRPSARGTRREEVRADAEDRQGQAPDVGGGVRQGQLAAAHLPPRMAGPRGGRPRLRQSVERFPASDGTLYLLRPGAGEDISLPALESHQRALLDGLDGTRTVDELAGLHAELTVAEVTETLAQLAELGLIEDAAADGDWLSPVERERYDRQLEYFGELVADGATRGACQARLRDARVVVIGLGGLGAWALWALAAAGVGELVGVDGDAVELSNLQRQTLYREQDIGQRKALATARTLADFNSSIRFEPIDRRLEGPDAVGAIVAGADFVIEAADWPPYRLSRWINACCAEAGVPHIAAAQFPPLIRVGPTFVPGSQGCLSCLEEGARATDPLFDELAAWRQQADTVAATFAPACALIGGILSSDVIHHLTGLAEPATLRASVVLDIRTLEQRRIPVEPVANCPVCG
jgi:molybdopterin-synthase adenylyltransferase